MIKTNLLRYLLILCLIVSGQLSKAQLPLPAHPVYTHFNSYNSDLPTDLIYRVFADKNGYIWLATDRGLMRYNGKEFRSVATGSTEDFVSAFRTRKGVLWLFAYSGRTAGIDLNTQRVVHTDSAYGLNASNIPIRPYLIGIERNDTVFLAKQSFKYVVVIPPGKKGYMQKMSSAQFSAQLLQQYGIPAVLNGRNLNAALDSVLIRRNSNGLSVLDSFVIIHNKIFSTNPSRPAMLYFDGAAYGINDCIVSFTLRDGDLYLGTLGGAGFCKIAGFSMLPRGEQTVTRLLPGETVTWVEQDYLHNIWVSTYGNGLFLFSGSDAFTLHYDKATSGLYQDEVTMIRSFPEGINAIGYHNGRIDMYGPSGGRRSYSIPAREYRKSVLHMERVHNHWLAFTRTEAFSAALVQGAVPYPGRFEKSPVRKQSFVVPGYKNGIMRNGTFYYVSSNNGIIEVDTQGALGAHAASAYSGAKKISLLPLNDSTFFIGTVRGGYYNTLRLPYLTDAQINSLDTVDQMLLLGTNSGVYAVPLGQARNGKDIRLLSLSPCFALKHDHEFTYVHSTDEMIILENGTWRIAGRFSFKRYVIPFRLNDFYSDGNNLVLAGNRGIFYIPKSNLIHRDTAPEPRIHVLSSLTGYSPADTVYQCPYNKDLSGLFAIDILDYNPAEKEITYRLFKDGEEIYRQTGLPEKGQVNFQPSGPGVYRFEYSVRWRNGYQDRTAAYTLILMPLWYQQWWWPPLLILLSLCVVWYLLYRWSLYTTRRNQRKLEQKMYLQELESKSFFGQLKPHFIFNILTPLQGYFIREEKIKGLDYLNSFSSLMRGILNGIRDKYITLQHEISFIEQYLRIQQERFGHCFEYQIIMSPVLAAERYTIPTLLIQPVIENAIEHGIDKTKDGGLIEIRIEETTDALMITIRDNGAGLPPGFVLKENHALKIITERMALLQKMEGVGAFRITTHEGIGQGTTATFLLAKKYKTNIPDNTQTQTDQDYATFRADRRR